MNKGKYIINLIKENWKDEHLNQYIEDLRDEAKEDREKEILEIIDERIRKYKRFTRDISSSLNFRIGELENLKKEISKKPTGSLEE